MKERIPVLVITGPVGSGKSTIVSALSEELERLAIQHAAIDMDHLRWVYPNPPGDAFAAQLGYRNLAAIWPNLQIVPLQCVLLADVVESRAQVDDYAAAMPGSDVIVVRLEVPMPLIMERLEARESEHSLAWYRSRAPELQAIMEREQVADLVIDVGQRSPADVALEILRRSGIVC
jgi:shikimate kinase